jgi:hypothetical protein
VSGFYDVGPVRQVAINLFYGWGYNFYRRENQLRADDQLVRAKACWLLDQARTAVARAESEYRRAHMPPPTRAQPFPPAEALAGAQALERLSAALGALEGQVRSQPVPENDRMTERHREEAPTLERLALADQDLIGRAEVLRARLDGQSGEAMLQDMAAVSEGLELIRSGLTERARLLL